MSQHYSDPTRADDPHALPDIETFRAAYGHCSDCGEFGAAPGAAGGAGDSMDCPAECGGRVPLAPAAWFYWFCLPGCMPDSDPSGPFKTEAEALENAREC